MGFSAAVLPVAALLLAAMTMLAEAPSTPSPSPSSAPSQARPPSSSRDPQHAESLSTGVLIEIKRDKFDETSLHTKKAFFKGRNFTSANKSEENFILHQSTGIKNYSKDSPESHLNCDQINTTYSSSTSHGEKPHLPQDREMESTPVQNSLMNTSASPSPLHKSAVVSKRRCGEARDGEVLTAPAPAAAAPHQEESRTSRRKRTPPVGRFSPQRGDGRANSTSSRKGRPGSAGLGDNHSQRARGTRRVFRNESAPATRGHRNSSRRVPGKQSRGFPGSGPVSGQEGRGAGSGLLRRDGSVPAGSSSRGGGSKGSRQPGGGRHPRQGLQSSTAFVTWFQTSPSPVPPRRPRWQGWRGGRLGSGVSGSRQRKTGGGVSGSRQRRTGGGTSGSRQRMTGGGTSGSRQRRTGGGVSGSRQRRTGGGASGSRQRMTGGGTSGSRQRRTGGGVSGSRQRRPRQQQQTTTPESGATDTSFVTSFVSLPETFTDFCMFTNEFIQVTRENFDATMDYCYGNNYHIQAFKNPVKVVWVGVVYLLVVLGNGVLLLVTLGKRENRSSTINVYIAFLSVADTFAVTVQVCLRIQESLLHDAAWDFFYVDWEPACRSLLCLTVAINNCCSWLLVAFTFDRFICIVLPLKRSEWCTRVRAVSCSIVIVVLSCAVGSYAFFIEGEEDFPTCTDAIERNVVVLWVINSLVGQVTPLVVMLVLNAWCVVKLVRRKRFLRQAASGRDGPVVDVATLVLLVDSCVCTLLILPTACINMAQIQPYISPGPCKTAQDCAFLYDNRGFQAFAEIYEIVAMVRYGLRFYLLVVFNARYRGYIKGKMLPKCAQVQCC